MIPRRFNARRIPHRRRISKRFRRRPSVSSTVRNAGRSMGGGACSFLKEQADLIVQVGPLRDVKLASMRAHASQLPGQDPRDLLYAGEIWDVK